MKKILKLGVLILLGMAAGAALGQSSDNFNYSGALSGWTVSSGAFRAALGYATGTGTGSGTSGWDIASFNGTFASNQYDCVNVRAYSSGNALMPAVRGSGTNTYISTYDGTNFQIYVLPAGTALATVAGSITVGHDYCLSANGTTLTLTDNTTRTTVLTATDSTYSSGNPGMYAYQTVPGNQAGYWFGGNGLPPAQNTVPTFSPVPGHYVAGTSVTLSCPNAGATPFYTTNGTPASVDSTPYTSPIPVTNTPINAVCANGGFTSSGDALGTYTSGSTTWYVRKLGGTRAQCTGTTDADYPGTGTGQACAFKDFRLLYDAADGTNYSSGLVWLIQGGDTVIIHDCNDGDGGHCRIGWDASTGGGSNMQCNFVPNAPYGCYNPPIPAGTSAHHTRILGANYAACNTGNDPKAYESNLAQLFGGFATDAVLNLHSTQYVDVQCIEITSHNGQCIYGTGQNFAGGPPACSHSQPVSDIAQSGILVDAADSNVLLQDVYVHGMNGAGMYGPVGVGIAMTRTNLSFNAFAAWNMDQDGQGGYPNAAGATIAASYVTMIGNGCYEEYPVVHSFSAWVCYDTNSGGFGDSWSGQNSSLSSFTCDHCAMVYNTKDGFIGPHPQIQTLRITNSVSYGNMGAQWKWGTAQNASVTFLNNLMGGNCYRMDEAIPGAAQNFASLFTNNVVVSGGVATVTYNASTTPIHNGDTFTLNNFNNASAVLNGISGTVSSVTGTTFQITVTGVANGTYTDGGWASGNHAYLTNFCRAAGNGFSVNTRPGTTSTYNNNSILAANPTVVFLDCGYYYTSGGSENNFTEENCAGNANVFQNNIFTGFADPAYNNGAPGLWYVQNPSTTNIAITSAYNIEYGIRNGDACTGTILCTSPLQVNQPSQPWPGSETALDVYYPLTSGNSFNLTSGSPAVSSGATYSGILSTDYNGNAQTSTPTRGAMVYTSGTPACATPVPVPADGFTSTTPFSASWSTSTPGATIYFTRDGSTPTTGSPIFSSPYTVSVTETDKAMCTAVGYTPSSVATASYTVNPPVTTPQVTVSGSVNVSGTVVIQ